MVQKNLGMQQARRGRPRQYDPDSALARAAAAFWKNGYAGTSLDDLAAATGMNRPRSLCRLRRQARPLSQDARTISAAIPCPVGPTPCRQRNAAGVFDPLLRRRAGALSSRRGRGARGCYSISTAPAQATSDPAVRVFLADSIRGTDAFLADVIGMARDRGEIAASADPSALAQVATATLHTLAVRSRVGGPRHQLKALAAAAIDLICGTAPRQQPRPVGKRGGKGQPAR